MGTTIQEMIVSQQWRVWGLEDYLPTLFHINMTEQNCP